MVWKAIRCKGDEGEKYVGIFGGNYEMLLYGGSKEKGFEVSFPIDDDDEDAARAYCEKILANEPVDIEVKEFDEVDSFLAWRSR